MYKSVIARSAKDKRDAAIYNSKALRLLRQKRIKKTTTLNCLAMTLKKTN